MDCFINFSRGSFEISSWNCYGFLLKCFQRFFCSENQKFGISPEISPRISLGNYPNYKFFQSFLQILFQWFLNKYFLQTLPHDFPQKYVCKFLDVDFYGFWNSVRNYLRKSSRDFFGKLFLNFFKKTLIFFTEIPLQILLFFSNFF